MVYLKVKESLQPVGLVHFSLCLNLRKTPCTRLENEQIASMHHQPLVTSGVSISVTPHLHNILFCTILCFLIRLCVYNVRLCVLNVVETDVEFRVTRTYIELVKSRSEEKLS